MLQVSQSSLFGASAVRSVPRVASEQVHTATSGCVAIEGAAARVSVYAKGRILWVHLVAGLLPAVVIDIYALICLLVGDLRARLGPCLFAPARLRVSFLLLRGLLLPRVSCLVLFSVGQRLAHHGDFLGHIVAEADAESIATEGLLHNLTLHV